MNELFKYRWPEGDLFCIVEGGDGDIGVVHNHRFIKIPLEAYAPLVREILERAPCAISSYSPLPDPAIKPGNSGIATDPFITMKTALMDASPALAAIAPMEDIDKLAEAACAAYGRHQTGEAYGLPPYEPPTCGTQHLLAERALRLLCRGTPYADPPSAADVEAISHLVDEAGVAFAREALARDAKPYVPGDDLPF